MERNKLIAFIENGKQVGISKVIKYNDTNIVYTYAIQKKQGKYIVCIDEYDLDNCYENENTEKTFIYYSLDQFIESFEHKYDVTFEDFNVSKGQKFFNAELYV